MRNGIIGLLLAGAMLFTAATTVDAQGRGRKRGHTKQTYNRTHYYDGGKYYRGNYYNARRAPRPPRPVVVLPPRPPRPVFVAPPPPPRPHHRR